jgi:hypothetical protein
MGLSGLSLNTDRQKDRAMGLSGLRLHADIGRTDKATDGFVWVADQTGQQIALSNTYTQNREGNSWNGHDIGRQNREMELSGLRMNTSRQYSAVQDYANDSV